MADRGWILEKIASEIQAEAIKNWPSLEVVILDSPTDTADLTYFLPESSFKKLSNSISVTHLAHLEDDRGAKAHFEMAAKSSDACITGSRKYEEILRQLGVLEVKQIHYGVDLEVFSPRVKIGVVGRTYDTGRKGEDLLSSLMDIEALELKFTGSNWPLPGVYYSPGELAGFYRDIDYLLIPSKIEGGPVPMLEALASGCKVIAPTDIGFVEDFPHIPFEVGNSKSLRDVVLGLIEEKNQLRDSVMMKSWSESSRLHLEFFQELLHKHRRRIGILEEFQLPNKPLKVAIISHGTETSTKGGPTTRINFLAQNFSRMGHSVSVFHNPDALPSETEFDIAHVFNSWPMDTARLALEKAKIVARRVIFSPIALDLWTYPYYRSEVEKVVKNKSSEILLELFDSFKTRMPEIRLAHLTGTNLIEGLARHHSDLRYLCSLPDTLILLSNYEKQFLSNLDIDIRKSVLVRNGVSEKYSEGDGGKLFREVYGVNDYVLCVGRIEFRKNQALISVALRDIPVDIVLIGDEGDEGYLEFVKNVSGGNVLHVPRIEDPELLASAYSGCVTFILPSWCEGAPLAALEAHASGADLILSTFSGEEEYFGDSATYIAPYDYTQLAEAVQKLLLKKSQSRDDWPDEKIEVNPYLERRHSEETLKVYRDSLRTSIATEGSIKIDVSSYIHALKVKAPLVGTFHVEKELINRLIRLLPQAQLICFNVSQNGFILVPPALLKNWSDEEFLSLTNTYTPLASSREMNSIQKLKSIAAVGARLLLRHKLRVFLVGVLGKTKIGRAIKGFLKRLLQERARHQFQVTDLQSNPKLKRVQREDVEFFRPNDVILSLGQSWLGNIELSLALSKAAKSSRLMTFVFDLSYLSGAHTSGWLDNDLRVETLRIILDKSSCVLTESKVVSRELTSLKNLENFTYEVQVIPIIGKDLSSLLSDKENLETVHTPYLLYISSFNKRKNHDFIIGVWKFLRSTNAKLNSHKLLLVGTVQGDLRFLDSEFLSDLAESGIEVLTGKSDLELARLYRDATFTLYPSKQEGWGLPVEESLLFGKVCLASNRIPAALEITNSAIIKLDPDDFFAWCAAIPTWINKVEMRKAFEREGLKHQIGDWDDAALKIKNLMRRI